MSNSRDIADSAATINFIDTVTSNVQDQIDNVDSLPTQSGNTGKFLTTNGSAASWATLVTDPTLGTLTQTFASGQASTISLTSSVLAPVVTVTKEVSQSGSTNNTWDVNSTSQNYTRLDSAPATTLSIEGFDVSTAVYSQTFSVAAQDIIPKGIAFNTNGSKMFVVGQYGQDINEYTLTTGFDVSTASYSQNFSVAAQESAPTDIAFNTDGTKMLIVGRVGNKVNEYALSTGFDVSTASFTDGFSVASQDTAPQGLAFNADGTKMFIAGNTNDTVFQYALTTGFDVSTASYSSVSFSVAATAPDVRGLAFNPSGTKMYVVDDTGNDVNEYALSTGFNVSTASFTHAFSVAAQESAPTGIAFNSTGSKMFIVGTNGDDVNEYELPLFLALGTGSFASADVGKTIEANSGVFVLTATTGTYVQTTAPTSFNQVASGSWSMFGTVYNTTDGDLELSNVYDSASGFDVSTASYSQSLSISAQETSPTGLAFNTDGTKMFVIGISGDDVNEYALTTGFNVSTASFTDSFSVSAQDTQPNAITFNPDGTQMYIVGGTGDDVNEYALSTGFDVSTASFTRNYSVSTHANFPVAIAFNLDGTKMFIVTNTYTNVIEYALSTGFNISTSSYTRAFDVSGQLASPQGLVFNPDGTKMFLTGQVSDAVNEYALSTAFNISTASFTDAFSVSAQEGAPKDVRFNTDGSKMFIVGNDGDAVYEYNVGATLTPTGYQPVHTTTSTDTTYWTDINSMTANQAAGSGNIYYAISTDDRTTWSVIKDVGGERDIVRNNGGTWQYNSNSTYGSETWAAGTTNTELATLAQAMEGASSVIGQFNVSTAAFSQSFSVASQEPIPTDISFNANGTKMFVLGSSGDAVHEYALTTGYDVSTASFTVSFSVSSQETVPEGLAFSPDGTKMFVVGINVDRVNEYTLTTGFDVSTASFTRFFYAGSQDTQPKGIAFNVDGTKMFLVGTAQDTVNEYALSTGFNVSTASFTDGFSISSQDATPNGLAFNANGTIMYIMGTSNRKVFQYALTTGFDVSTASYSSLSFSVASQDNSDPRGVFLNPDGTKMFVCSVTSDLVLEYAIGTTVYTNQMDKTQLDAVTDPNHIALSNDLDLAIVLNLTSGTTVPSSNGVAINYDANVLNKGAILGTDYNYDAPAQDKVRITALAANNLKVRIL